MRRNKKANPSEKLPPISEMPRFASCEFQKSGTRIHSPKWYSNFLKLAFCDRDEQTGIGWHVSTAGKVELATLQKPFSKMVQ